MASPPKSRSRAAPRRAAALPSPASLVAWLRGRRRGGLTKRFALFCASTGLLLGSATVPAAETKPAVEPAPAPGLIAVALNVPLPPLVPAPPPAPAPTPAPTPPAEAAAREATQPVRGAARSVRILVSLPLQRLYVFRGETLLATSPVSTGRAGHRTPTGRFPILQKRVRHFSNLYDNAPMPYMQRLTHDGIALHGGRLPGYPASHGCIRLPQGFARRLYRMTSFATVVTITSRRPKSSREAHRLL
ncbi:L,D-transpeptidase family protein [Sphingosinicella terrae]|uniref:L,D-transpeptidase family protein n=1 Tax=Sphingosinicella terrae TaxID=2172047 RepID=UPI000E0D0E39|nr:L,D-transpeptidase family protein [Sphingosinicella terrae]